MSLTIADLFASPDHFLQSFDGDGAVFVPMDRAAYGRSIFLDGRISPASEGQMRVPVSALSLDVPQPAPTGYIFHVAHCGSTLLARALDRPATNLVLREPLALRQCAVHPDATRLELTLATISKRYAADRRTVIKANVPVNFILDDIAARDPEVRAIFLHLGLRDYLLAILRNDGHRNWLRNVTAQLARYLGDLSALSDAELAAALWLAQMQSFAAGLKLFPIARTLDAEIFFADPEPTLVRAAAVLEVPMTEDDAATVVTSPLFSTYSKKPDLPFDNTDRVARRAALEQSLAGELAAAAAWIAGREDEAGIATAAIAAAAL